jgi:hypothetical protein
VLAPMKVPTEVTTTGPVATIMVLVCEAARAPARTIMRSGMRCMRAFMGPRTVAPAKRCVVRIANKSANTIAGNPNPNPNLRVVVRVKNITNPNYNPKLTLFITLKITLTITLTHDRK